MAKTDLDPDDWDDFRQHAHRLLDICIDRLSNADQHPWQPVPDSLQDRYAIRGQGSDLAQVVDRMAADVLPYHTGNTHPRFFGWVHGTGLASGLLSEMVAATMNSNCGGRDHGAIYMERAVIDWTRQVMGFPETSDGILVTGTSQATVIALATARLRAVGSFVRETGNGTHQFVAYAGSGVHNATRKALELLGIGHSNLRCIPDGSAGMDLDHLRREIDKDLAEGNLPFAIIGTAGSVDTGTFDDLNALADISSQYNLWLHVDGAFGAWTRLADDPWKSLSDGIGRADSLACDFHKWMYVPYDCGMVLVRDADELRATFAARPSYLAPLDHGLAGGGNWYCDNGIDLSRGNRALKVWTALEHYGPDRLGAAISDNCRLVAHMGDQISQRPKMALLRPIISNVCVFTADETLTVQQQTELNQDIAQTLQNKGIAVFSTTIVDGITCLRAAIVNHRSDANDIKIALDAVAEIAG